MALDVGSNYLLRDNLHIKPIGGRFGISMLNLSNSWTHEVDEASWGGKTAIVLSKAVLIAGAAVTLTVSLVECVAAGIIGGLGFSLCKATGHRCEFFEKHTLKVLSYSVSAAAYAVGSILAIFTKTSSNFVSAALDHLGHAGSAILVQMFVGTYFDRQRGLDEEETSVRFLTRAAYVIADDLPDLAGDLLRGVLRDTNLPNALDTLINFIGNPNLLQGNDGLGNMLGNWIGNIGQVIPGDDGAMVIDLFNGAQPVRDYQSHLQELTKSSYLEIVRSDELVKGFKDPDHEDDVSDIQSGRDSLEMCSAHTFPLLASWTQLKELQEVEEFCPAHFADSGNMETYNNRLEKIQAAKVLLRALNEEQQAKLNAKLLPVDAPVDDVEDPQVQAVYVAIGELAAQLYQGALVTRTTINIQNIQNGNGDQPIAATNIFQSAITEAQRTYQEEIGA